MTSALPVRAWRRLVALSMLAAAAFPAAAQDTKPGFAEPVADSKLAVATPGLPWYAAIEIRVTRAGDDAASPVLKDRRAKKAWDVIKRALGVDNGVDQYSFVVKPTISGVSLPPMTAIQVSHTKTGGIVGIGGSESVTVSTAPRIISAWVPIATGAKIGLAIEHVGSSNPAFSLLSDSSTFYGSLTKLPGLGMSAAAQPFLTLAASTVENAYKSATTFKTDTSLAIDSFPLGGDPAGYTFQLNDVDGRPIASIHVGFLFRRSLTSDPETLALTTYPDLSASGFDTTYFQMLDSNGNPQKVGDRLAANTGLSTGLKFPGDDAAGVTAFNGNCASLLGFLGDAGLNRTDSTFFAVTYLAPTLTSHPALRPGFWDQCLSGRKPIADGIRVSAMIAAPVIAAQPPTTMPLSPANAVKFGDYIMRHQASPPTADADGDATVLAMLAPAVLWSGDALTAAEARNRLDTVKAKAYHCSLRIPVDDPASQAQGVTIFLRIDGQPDQVLALTSRIGADEDSPAAAIALRSPSAAEIRACTNYENARSGAPPRTN